MFRMCRVGKKACRDDKKNHTQASYANKIPAVSTVSNWPTVKPMTQG